MNKNLLTKHISALTKLKGKKTTVLVYKGFPNHFLKELEQHIPHARALDFIDSKNKTHLESIINNADALLAAIKKTKSPLVFITFEEFLLIPTENITESIASFKIVKNNFYEYYPNQTLLEFPDIEDSINSDVEIEENELFNRFYSDCRQIAGFNCIQYLDYDLDLTAAGIDTIDFFDSSKVSLPAFLDDLSNEKNIIQYQAADGTYHHLKFGLFNDVVPKQINIIVDESINHIEKDLDELKLLFLILSEARCKVSFYTQHKSYKDYWRPELDVLLQKHWGEQAKFKKLNIYKSPDTNKELIEHSQGSIVEHIIRQVEKSREDALFEDIFLTAPTGAGKSLLFQLPAIYLSENEKLNSVTIVVSPLKALMYDQVQALINDRHFEKVAFVNSDLSLIERKEILDKVMNGDISVLYLSPELLLAYELQTFIGSRELGLLIIDEAHLVTTWGRDFRIDYWFLGNFIRKLRGNGTVNKKIKGKIKTYRFPVVALTATAVYNGADDMVFDTIRTLNMQNCRTYIGNIMRPEISFDYQPFTPKQYDVERMTKTISRIREYVESNNKTILYFPWVTQINNITHTLDADIKPKVKKYYGELSPTIRKETIRDFKSGKTKVVLATKAFGMGVDISDIENVYHHAPSGSLADYVQEIGRIARVPGMKGIAKMDFNPKDLKYSKMLFMLSSLKQFQVDLVLKKINKLFMTAQDKNLLVSVEDFKWIFTKDNNPEQKVKSALLVIEKDLVEKYGYNVLIVKPKSMFSTVYGAVDTEGFELLKQRYGEHVEEINKTKYERAGTKLKNGAIVMREEKEDKKNVKLVLDKIWETAFPQESFPDVRTKFFDKRLFPYVEPLMKMRIHFTGPIAAAGTKLENGINFIGATLASLDKKMFRKEDLTKQFLTRIKNETTCTKLTDLICTFFVDTDQFGQSGKVGMSTGNFLVAKQFGFLIQYRFDAIAFSKVKTQLLRNFQILFDGVNANAKQFTGFIPADMDKAKEKIKMIYLLEIFELSTYEISGGEAPQLMVRINDPKKLNSLSKLRNENKVVTEIERKHKDSMEIMTYFFQNNMSNEQRWQYIEDYFLGHRVGTAAEEEQEIEDTELES